MTYDCNFGIINADRQKLTRKEFHMINFKVGIMGAGKIAGVIADTLKDLDAFEAYAIASRLSPGKTYGEVVQRPYCAISSLPPS